MAWVTPPDPRYDVVGIGNALVDIIAHVDDAFLVDHDLVKGAMTLVETDRALELHTALPTAIEMSGGSAANTVCGVASLGGTAAYIGKVSADDLGGVFDHDLRAVGVRFSRAAQPADVPTGRCIIAVTDDAERTMNTYLGASSLLAPDDIDSDVVAAGAVLYMEGYLFDRDDAKAAFRHAAAIAHEAGRLVSLTLSDSFCVDRHRDDFLSLVADDVDLLFGNADEVCSLYQVDDLAVAIEAVRRDCSSAAITVGARGCVVVADDTVAEVPATPVPKVVDTTGAGDLFASGYLFGLTHGYAPHECARLGAIAAGEIISHVGPRPLVELRTLL